MHAWIVLLMSHDAMVQDKQIEKYLKKMTWTIMTGFEVSVKVKTENITDT